ncbi:hypothetical protein DSM106972_043870 [Dulcicalothrix desertica PCC 7102]|uniref:Uncharacterized protein n=1 Tax=Dulcicalothrix desertica PCC 7102 TaxID=232991 RepID=A0A433VFD4_9CYAN|nr:hypothetical protein [Dulcicalothrix desertica]RUT04818.1 hypothetical protein DSM106972_043870 [Dulcicalothrix desertica PCC 7102]TWH42830.1 hypothetical protein CAL7102_06507 [Dulcicalothrix desertica PCC 7102]
MYSTLLLISQLLTVQITDINNTVNVKYPYLCTQAEIVNTKQNQASKRKGSFQDMLNALGERETGRTGATAYRFINPQLYFLGKYQFAEVLLRRLGYYKAQVYYGNGADKNYWRGTWTNKRGIDSKNKFLNSPNVQETAIKEAFAVYWQDVNSLLKQRGKSINQYLNKPIKFKDGNKLKTITITLSGLLAATHLRGPDNMVNLLVQGKVSRDEFGTSILDYLEMFSGYDTTLKDIQ